MTTEQDILQTILSDSNYHLSLFQQGEIQSLRSRVFMKKVRGKDAPYVKCVVRGRDIRLKPEEVVRQLYALRLVEQYGYPKNRLVFEYPVNFGRAKKRADIVIRDKDRPDTPYAIVEVKKPRLRDGKNQLRSYCNATGAPIGVWTNGEQISHYNRKDPNYFEDISDVPNASQSLADILNERFTLKDLILKDKLVNERKSLKDIILDLEDEVLANAGVDVFEEVFKLIFTKLYDESLSQADKNFLNRFVPQVTDMRVEEPSALYFAGKNYDDFRKAVESVDDATFRSMEFRNTGQTEHRVKEQDSGSVQSGYREVARGVPSRLHFRVVGQPPGYLRVRVAGCEAVQFQFAGRGRGIRVSGEQVGEGRKRAVFHAAPCY